MKKKKNRRKRGEKNRIVRNIDVGRVKSEDY